MQVPAPDRVEATLLLVGEPDAELEASAEVRTEARGRLPDAPLGVRACEDPATAAEGPAVTSRPPEVRAADVIERYEP